jgi:hypothetical protein
LTVPDRRRDGLPRYDGRIEAFDAVLAYLNDIRGNGYDDPRDPAFDAVYDKVKDLRSRATAARAVDRAALTEAAPPPIGFDVTDDVLDAPDGARVMFERVGGRWEPAEAAPPSGALDPSQLADAIVAIRTREDTAYPESESILWQYDEMEFAERLAAEYIRLTPEPTDDREAGR